MSSGWLQTHRFTYAFRRAELVGTESVCSHRVFLTFPLGAFFNGVFLLGLALSIFLQSIERFLNVEVVDSPKLVLIIGAIGLALNIISALFVHG